MQKERQPSEPDTIPQDMQDALTKFNAEAKRISDSSLGHLESVEPPTIISTTQQIHRADETPSVKFRQRPYSLVRYWEFDWKSKASPSLKQIVVGPSADREKAHQFARACVREFHGGDIEVIQSEIPHRSVL